MLGHRLFELDVAVRDRAGQRERPRFEAVRNDPMLRAAEFGRAFDLHHVGSGATNVRPHLVEHRSET